MRRSKIKTKKTHGTPADEEESDAPVMSVASSMSSRGKKRKLVPEATTPVVPEKLLQEIGSSSPADISAEHADR